MPILLINVLRTSSPDDFTNLPDSRDKPDVLKVTNARCVAHCNYQIPVGAKHSLPILCNFFHSVCKNASPLRKNENMLIAPGFLSRCGE